MMLPKYIFVMLCACRRTFKVQSSKTQAQSNKSHTKPAEISPNAINLGKIEAVFLHSPLCTHKKYTVLLIKNVN